MGYYQRASRCTSGSSTDNYIKAGASMKLPPPPELENKDLRIKMLLQDNERSNTRIIALESTITMLKKRNKQLKLLVEELKKRAVNGGNFKTLRQIREERGMTHEELSRRVGVSDGGLYKLEQGKNRWRRGVVDKVCEVLGIDEKDGRGGEIVER